MKTFFVPINIPFASIAVLSHDAEMTNAFLKLGRYSVHIKKFKERDVI
jgi:hypothetical protein